MENRNGLLVGLKVSRATGPAERETAIEMIDEQKRKWIKVRTWGADKGYDTKEFVEKLREKKVTLHVATNGERRGVQQ
jgi:hypothetical protein